MMLRELRKQKKLTQAECAKYLGVPLRTYQNYETDAAKRTSIKYLYMLEKLEQYGFVDEDHGILSIQKIKDVCTDVFADYDIEYCYLFGSYAKGKATETSDVDLLIGTSVSGIHFYGLVEAIREGLHKRVDIKKTDQYYIDKIITDLTFIRTHTESLSKSKLEEDEILVDSIMFRLIQVAENSEKLTEKFKETYPSIPWRAIKGLRNRIVHEYGNVDLTIVYDTVKKDIPELIGILEGICRCKKE